MQYALSTGRGIAVLLAGATVALMAMAGCSNKSNENPPANTTVVTNPPPSPSPAPTTTVVNANTPATNNVNAGQGGPAGANAAVADAVNKAIHTNVQLTGSRITAVVDSAGIATLAGTAQNQQQKALAVKAATDTSGVTSVKDKIVIAPTISTKPKVATKVIHETKVIVVPNGAPFVSGANNGNSKASTESGSSAANDNGTSTSTDSSTTSSNSQKPAPGSGQ